MIRKEEYLYSKSTAIEYLQKNPYVQTKRNTYFL